VERGCRAASRPERGTAAGWRELRPVERSWKAAGRGDGIPIAGIELHSLPIFLDLEIVELGYWPSRGSGDPSGLPVPLFIVWEEVVPETSCWLSVAVRRVCNCLFLATLRASHAGTGPYRNGRNLLKTNGLLEPISPLDVLLCGQSRDSKQFMRGVQPSCVDAGLTSRTFRWSTPQQAAERVEKQIPRRPKGLLVMTKTKTCNGAAEAASLQNIPQSTFSAACQGVLHPRSLEQNFKLRHCPGMTG
jgi:hypothetical protein